MVIFSLFCFVFFFSSRRRHTRCALVTGVQTCALPIYRTAFRNARFTIEAGSLAGEWRMSAIPYFNQQTGRFQGYRGNARRPHLHEMTATAGWRDGLYGSDRQRESLRELIHELRTPLNAILGFAEIIDHQFFGPVGVRYREIAQDI